VALFCLDVGNTHAHWGVVDGRNVLAHGEIPTTALDTVALTALLAAHPSAGVAFASVVPAATAVLQPTLLSCGRP
jgi:pantothenate kinase type III